MVLLEYYTLALFIPCPITANNRTRNLTLELNGSNVVNVVFSNTYDACVMDLLIITQQYASSQCKYLVNPSHTTAQTYFILP